MSGKTSAGPQSVILDASTYEDLRDIKPDNDGITGPADRSVLIGTASKGIINRHQQHNAQVILTIFNLSRRILELICCFYANF